MTTDNVQTRFVTYICVRGHATDPDDRHIPGYYAVELSSESLLDLDHLDPLQQNQAIDMALDTFYDHEIIESPDDFEVTVYLDDGTLLEYDEYISSEDALFTADYLGRITKPDVLKKR